MEILVLAVVAGLAILLLRRMQRQPSDHLTETFREGDLAVFVPALDALREGTQVVKTMDSMHRLLDEGVKTLVVDLSRQGNYMEDKAYGVLGSVLAKGRDIEGFRMVLVCPSERMMAFIKMVKFDIIFDVVESREDAERLLAVELPEMAE